MVCTVFFTCECTVLYGIFGGVCTVFAENHSGHPVIILHQCKVIV